MSQDEIEETIESEATPVKKTKKGGSSKKSIIIGVVALVLILGGLYAHQAGYFSGVKKGDATADNATAPAEETVATVNGQEISKAVLDARFSVARQSDAATDEATLKQQVLSGIIDEILVLQNAQKAGIAPSADEVQKQFDIIKARFESEEAFNLELNTQNVTVQDVYADIQRQLVIQSYLASKIDESTITVSDEEVQTFYNTSVAGQESAPTFEEVKDQIKTQIQTQKSQQAVQGLLAQLRSESSIQTSL